MGWGPDPQEIIFHLLQLGVEFRVCIRDRVYGQPRPQLVDAHGQLGYRRKGYKPTVIDHGVYVTLRDRFFASPRGRAARLAGGIIRRLAFEVVDNTLASVGPGSEVFETGVRFWDGSSSAAYWDDTLTDQEIDIICGVYEIATGDTEDPQLSKLSWWPKPHAFSTSGLNTGWWSPDCERWFLQRQAVINSGRAILHTQTECKSKIRYYKQPRKIGMANDRTATQFLSTRLSR
ncbi:hypothetical protein B0H11DRAFT_1727461 [Mycena galericulata]|nr:hypothetical protein B0H11DRAFT_1727461 [Mycena galericulata]